MRLFTSFLVLCLCSLSLPGQNEQYEPTLIILAPHNYNLPKSLRAEFDKTNEGFRVTPATEDDIRQMMIAYADEPENIQLIQEKTFRFASKTDFIKGISLSSATYLSYRFFENFPNLLIYPIDKTSDGKTDELAAIAKTENVQFVLNIPQVDFKLKRGEKSARIKVQLYNQSASEMVIEQEFDGKDTNPGFEFACQSGSLDCTINNALAQALPQVIAAIAARSPTLKRQRMLATKRWQVIESQYYPRKPPRLIPEILFVNDTGLSDEGYFQGLINADSSQFVGFFLQNQKGAKLDNLIKNSDKSVKILSQNLTNPDILSYMGRIVVGVKHNGRWLMSQKHVTYFPAEDLEQGKREYFANLLSWGFFEENSAKPADSFWTTNLFKKVPDLTKDPDWEHYGDNIWKTDEIRNRPYIGQFEIVAEVLQAEAELIKTEFIKTMESEVFAPAYDALKAADSSSFKSYAKLNYRLVLIHPQDKSIILNPIVVEDEQGLKTARYFVYLPAEQAFYEWNYLPSGSFEKNQKYLSREKYIQPFLDLDYWYFFQQELNDQDFWNDLVLKKENGKYKYLERLF